MLISRPSSSPTGDPRLHRVVLVPPAVDPRQQEAVRSGGAGSVQGHPVFAEERGAPKTQRSDQEGETGQGKEAPRRHSVTELTAARGGALPWDVI